MHDGFKKATAVVTGGVFGVVIIGAQRLECRHNEMCAVENQEAPHTHQEHHDPLNEIGAQVVVATTTGVSSIGEYTFLRRTDRGTVYFKKLK